MVTNNTKPVCRAAVDLVRHFEGLYREAYLCPAGVPTIGYGHTGSDVHLGMTITEAQAEQQLGDDLAGAAAIVDKFVRLPLPENPRGALASFVFNLGAGSLASSTLLRKLNVGDATASAEFCRWVNATVNGKPTKLPGLVARRAAEQALFEGKGWQAPDATPHPMPQAVVAPIGSDADRIRAIQRAVGVVPDGVYGPLTKAAVVAWQAKHFLVADGVVGPKTAAAMDVNVLRSGCTRMY